MGIWEGRPGLEPRVEKRVNQAVFPITTNWAKSACSKSNLSTPKKAFQICSLIQTQFVLAVPELLNHIIYYFTKRKSMKTKEKQHMYSRCVWKPSTTVQFQKQRKQFQKGNINFHPLFGKPRTQHSECGSEVHLPTLSWTVFLTVRSSRVRTSPTSPPPSRQWARGAVNQWEGELCAGAGSGANSWFHRLLPVQTPTRHRG